MNQVCLIGNLTRDPEFRTAGTGTKIANFGLAVRGFKKDETVFVDVTAFGGTADIIERFANKGQQIGISGRLELDRWEDRNTGQKRQKLYVVASNVTLAGRREVAGSNADGGDAGPTRMHTETPARRSEPETDEMDSVPF